MTADDGQRGFADEIMPDRPQHAVPMPQPLDTFMPWHLPRKQWIRREHWGSCAKRLIRELELSDRPVRYLTLPGTDLLDIQVLAEVCAEAGQKLRYLGFNRGSQSPVLRTTQLLAESALLAMDGVDHRSKVVSDDILSLSSRNSVAQGHLRECGCFDIVNLDFCDVLTTKHGKPVHSAMQGLLEHQCNTRTEPWLLFITTTVDRDAIASDDLRQYRTLLEANAAASEDFRGKLVQLVGTGAVAAGEPVVPENFGDIAGVGFGRLLSVGIGKWLLGVLKAHQWRVELKLIACYRRGLVNLGAKPGPVPEPELFSLVFGLERNAVLLKDETGLAKVAGVPAKDWAQAEMNWASKMLTRAGESVDLDCLMQSQPGRRSVLVDETAVMLRSRNYDEGKYRAWVAGVPLLPC